MVNSNETGNWGERVAAAMLSLSLSGQTKWVSLEGERQHLDLMVDFTSPFDGSARSLPVQVKTGSSFGAWAKGRWRMDNIDRTHVIRWRESRLPTLLVWVQTEPITKAYWRLILPRTPLETLSISRHNLVNPAATYELERMWRLHTTTRIERLSLELPAAKTFVEDRNKARSYWNGFGPILDCMNLGPVAVTRHGWRHMTRASKSRSRIHDSLRLIRYLPVFLKREANTVETTDLVTRVEGSIVVEERTILLTYRNIHFCHEGYFSVYFRVRYSARFPQRWMLMQSTDWQLKPITTVESIYRKPE